MEAINLFKSPEIDEILKQYKENKQKKKKASYNLFTISSVNSYLENFHSDIIASLLNPKGLHQEKYTFLHLFINFLNQHYDTKIISTDFSNVIVTREKGRLDIWIRDETSRQSIIIENKINNAPDMLEQIDRYFEYAEAKRKYSVKAIIYLTLDGTKKAPPIASAIPVLVKNIGAFSNLENDLVNGWLTPCLKKATNMDSSSFIHQYTNLIKHLATKSMDVNTMENFYQILSLENNLEKAKVIGELYDRLCIHRADKFSNAIPNYYPFKKQFRYDKHYWFYENYQEGNNIYKLDIWFLNNGNASIVFWNPGVQGQAGRDALTEKLKSINYLQEFEDDVKYDNGYPKNFLVGDTFKNMIDVDNAIIVFVKKFLNDLKPNNK
jgi:hypothetical protein